MRGHFFVVEALSAMNHRDLRGRGIERQSAFDVADHDRERGQHHRDGDAAENISQEPKPATIRHGTTFAARLKDWTRELGGGFSGI